MGAPARLTEHQPRQTSVTAVNSQIGPVSDPSHVPPLTARTLSTLQGDAGELLFKDVLQLWSVKEDRV